jgi:hypothetical protein
MVPINERGVGNLIDESTWCGWLIFAEDRKVREAFMDVRETARSSGMRRAFT